MATGYPYLTLYYIMDLNIKSFWEQGSGSELLRWSGAEQELHTSEQIDQRRNEYDILGDNAVEEIFKDKNFGEAYALITRLSATKINENTALPDSVKQL